MNIQYMYEEINMHNLYLMTKCLRIFYVLHTMVINTIYCKLFVVDNFCGLQN